MRKLFSTMLLLGFVALYALPVIAQTTTAADVSMGDVVSAGADLATQDWEKLGVLGALIAITNFLIIVSKLKVMKLNDWLKEKGLKWLRPLFAVVLAAILGLLSSLHTGTGAMQSLVTGLMAGVGSVGFHELKEVLTKKGREKRAT